MCGQPHPLIQTTQSSFCLGLSGAKAETLTLVGSARAALHRHTLFIDSLCLRTPEPHRKGSLAARIFVLRMAIVLALGRIDCPNYI